VLAPAFANDQDSHPQEFSRNPGEDSIQFPAKVSQTNGPSRIA